MNNSILYYLNDWYDNNKANSVTIYRDNRDGYVTCLLKNKWNKIVGRKKFRLIGEHEPVSQMWWNYNSPLGFTEAEASESEVAAYFNRRKRGRRKKQVEPMFTKEHNAERGRLGLVALFGEPEKGKAKKECKK